MLVIVVMALFTIDHPLIKKPRDKLLNEGVGILTEVSKVQRSPAANMAKNNIMSSLTLTATEQGYITKTMSNDEKLQIFQTRYCVNNEINMYFYENRLNTVCRIIINAFAEQRG